MVSAQCSSFYQTLKQSLPKGQFSIQEMRAFFETMMKQFPAAPDITLSSVNFAQCQGLWIKAPSVSSSKMVLFFHGGGYISGSSQSHQDILGRISRYGGISVCTIDYRLAPEHPFPAALEDALYTYQALLKHGFKSHQIIVGGSSAGGGLALALLLKLKQLHHPLPRAGVLICPWVDLAVKGKTILTNQGLDLISRDQLIAARNSYLGFKGNSQDPYASPLYGDLTQLPPLLIQSGTIEILWSEIESLVQKAQKNGVKVSFEPYDGMFHAWQLFATKIPEGDQALQSIGRYIQSI